jgi:hypothetical protein
MLAGELGEQPKVEAVSGGDGGSFKARFGGCQYH